MKDELVTIKIYRKDRRLLKKLCIEHGNGEGDLKQPDCVEKAFALLEKTPRIKANKIIKSNKKL